MLYLNKLHRQLYTYTVKNKLIQTQRKDEMLMVPVKYTYNEKTHTLHIKNYCHFSNGAGYIEFDSEDEAVKYAGRALGMCKNCMRKRDKEGLR